MSRPRKKNLNSRKKAQKSAKKEAENVSLMPEVLLVAEPESFLCILRPFAAIQVLLSPPTSKYDSHSTQL